MTNRDKIHDYLRKLSTYLARLHHDDAEEVLKEIESHIYDALEIKGEETSVDSILDGFGNPRELASKYVDHILEGTPPPAGFKAIQSVKKGVTAGLYYSTALFGYGWSLAQLILGFYQLLFSSNLSLWKAEHGQSYILGSREHLPAGAEDIIGFWIVPVALILGGASLYLTYRLLGILKRKL